MSQKLTPDIEAAQRFLNSFDEEEITFQIFDDKKLTRRADHFTARIDDPAAYAHLQKMNAENCGVYFMLNKGDGHGRSVPNVTHIRVLALDLDGAPKEPVLNAPILPHYIIESSPGRYQCFYLIKPIPIAEFSALENATHWFALMQKSLARKFQGDESVIDLPRVFRVPGFWHMKRDPHQIKIIHAEGGLPYDVEKLMKELGIYPIIEKIEGELKQPLPSIDDKMIEKIKTGERHQTLLRYACKYAHIHRIGPVERKFILQGLNKHACDIPIDDHDLERINVQATRYAEEERGQLESVDVTALLNKHRAASERPQAALPTYLLEPRGLVGEVMRYILGAALKPQPELALAAAFVACGTVMGRKVRTETNLRTNLYFLSLAETGSGKDWPRQAVKLIFDAAGAPQRAAVEDVTSDSAIGEAVVNTPSQVFLFDEFGRFMQNITNKNAAVHMSAIPTLLMRVYSSANVKFNAKTFVDPKHNQTVNQPNVSTFMTSVEKSFYSAITKEAVEDGLLNRFIFLPSTDPDPAIRDVQNSDLPQSIVDEFTAWESMPYRAGNMGSIENVTTMPPQPRIVGFADGAREIFRDMEHDLRIRRRDLRKESMSGLFTRVYENALKIALILASGQNRIAPQISVNDAEYACELMLVTTNNLYNAVNKNVSDNQVESRHKLVLNLIKDAGPDGIALKELGQRARAKGGLDSRARTDILRELMEWGTIVETLAAGTTKPSKIYRFIRD